MKGISLIVLVITIIVIIILAGSVILSIASNNPIEKANEAKFKNDISTFNSELMMYESKQYADGIGNFNLNELNASNTTNPKITDIIKSMEGGKIGNQLYSEIFEIQKGALVLKNSVEDPNTITWSQEANVDVKSVERVESTSAIWEFDAATGTISGYKDEFIAESLVIPNYIDGIPVKSVSGNRNDIASVIQYQVPYVTQVTISYGIETIGDFAFLGCSPLTSVVIPDSVTSIGTAAFASCINLSSVVMSKNTTNIGESAFAGCSNLFNILIPDNVVNIDSNAFSNTHLTSITIPNSVVNISSNAFQSCNYLQSITINKSTDSISGKNWGAPSALVTWNN